MTLSLGIIGCPIGHSISPVFQQAALDHLGIDADYQAWELEPEGVGKFLQALRQPDNLGINVTVPHKEAVIPFLDAVDEGAQEAGAVNTIVQLDGQLTGYNTDSYGFLQALREARNFTCGGKRILLLGAGGAARGVVLALIRERVAELVIANRTLARGERLASITRERGIACRTIEISWNELALAAVSADLIINCTTVGMSHGPDSGHSLLLQQQIPPTALVYDLVYNPMETPLLRAASRAGASTLGGIQMLVHQGAASFELWTGKPAPIPIMLEAATKAMAEVGSAH